MQQAADVVHEFWRRMATNDFDAVGALLAEGFVLEWPQSRERIRGAANFVRMNREYPAHGPWRFTLHRIVAEGANVVSHVGMSAAASAGQRLHPVPRARRAGFFAPSTRRAAGP